jgi:hypothetical protein
METIFNFSNKDTEFIYSLHLKSEIILHIKRKSKSVASLYFTNQINEKINIPSEFFVYQNSDILEPDKETQNDYTLWWNGKYDIVYRGETLHNIRPEKTWKIYN